MSTLLTRSAAGDTGVAGAILQVLIIAMYFAVSPQRDPTFELWGITIRILQFALLAVLAYLAARPQGNRDGR